MLPYLLIFGVPAVASVSEKGAFRRFTGAGLIMTGICLALMIGLRYRIGADWSTYAGYLEQASYKTISEIMTGREPGYNILNWAGAQLELDVWSVNLVCGAIFAWGLVLFCSNQPRPWLALTVAIPYLVIVVAMGYSRQGVAIGLSMIALVALSRGSILKFVFWIALGAMFHRTAILMIPIAALASSTNRFWTFVWVGMTGIVLYFLVLDEAVDSYIYIYMEREYSSQGAFIRTVMNVIPALAFLVFGKRMARTHQEYTLWRLMSFASIALFAGFFVSSSSTAIDRIALYMIPLQMYVFSRLPGVLGGRRLESVIVVSIVAYYCAIMLTWLTISSYAIAWVPYKSFLFREF